MILKDKLKFCKFQLVVEYWVCDEKVFRQMIIHFKLDNYESKNWYIEADGSTLVS